MGYFVFPARSKDRWPHLIEPINVSISAILLQFRHRGWSQYQIDIWYNVYQSELPHAV